MSNNYIAARPENKAQTQLVEQLIPAYSAVSSVWDVKILYTGYCILDTSLS
jgi:hypothetical protein